MKRKGGEGKGESGRDRRSDGFEGADEAVCAANYSCVFGVAEKHGSACDQ